MVIFLGDIDAEWACLWFLVVYNLPMPDDFTDIPTFVAVVEAGGFSTAARRLNISRSAVGKAVARLEAGLRVRLFHRTTRSQSLTEDGQAFYEHCQRALEALRAGKAMLDSGRKTAAGKLHVSMPVLFGRLCVAPLLTQLATLHPKLELELNFSDRLANLVEDGFDLAIRNGPLGDGAGLMARRIAHERTMIFAAPSYIKEQGEPDTLADLLRHQAVTYSRNGRVQTWLFPQDGAAPQQVTPPTRLRFDDLDAIADAAVAGFGLAWLPDWLASARVRAGELVKVLDSLPALVTDVHAIWPETPHLATRVRVAIDALAAGLPALTTA